MKSGGLDLVRQVEGGRLSGAPACDGAVAAFKGIPYAAAPLGPLRWRAPRKPEPWSGIRDATSFSPNAPQFPIVANSLYAGGHEHQSEDCLYLNVWTPAGPGSKLPVFFWLHFGAFQFGGASVPLYAGDELARTGAVVVTLNYRLGRLGFLAHPDLTRETGTGASGNWGLMDQLAALEWVQRNIASFGGDPDNVTLAGLSAGSSSVCLHLLSPLAQGLFHRAVGMSGAQLGPVGRSGGIGDGLQDLDHAERSGLRVARVLGAASLDDLRASSVEALMAVPSAEDSGPRWSVDAGMQIGLGAFDSAYPIVDGHLVPDDPYALYEAGRFHPVPLLTGSTADERSGIPFLTSDRDFLGYAQEDYGELAAEFLELFPAGSDAAARDSSARANGDRIFIWQNWALARLHARARTAPTFYYHTSRMPPLPPDHALAEPDPGAFHSLEIPYLFRHLDVRPWPWEERDRRLSDVISGAWLAFASGGDPNGPGLPRWERFDPDAPAALHLGDEIGMGPIPRPNHLAFWDRYYERRRRSSTAAAR